MYLIFDIDNDNQVLMARVIFIGVVNRNDNVLRADFV